MRAVVCAVVFFGIVVAGKVVADPGITDQRFDCEFLSQFGGSWSKQGRVSPAMQGRTLILAFEATDEGSALDQLRTTGTPSEYQVEARCPGFVTLSDNKPFKIRDFKFDLSGAFIGSAKGKIELNVRGQAKIVNTNQSDSFEKGWKIDKAKLDGGSGFDSMKESNTVCGQQLIIRFEDLRGLVMREKSSDEPTELGVNFLSLNLDPC